MVALEGKIEQIDVIMHAHPNSYGAKWKTDPGSFDMSIGTLQVPEPKYLDGKYTLPPVNTMFKDELKLRETMVTLRDKHSKQTQHTLHGAFTICTHDVDDVEVPHVTFTFGKRGGFVVHVGGVIMLAVSPEQHLNPQDVHKELKDSLVNLARMLDANARSPVQHGLRCNCGRKLGGEFRCGDLIPAVNALRRRIAA